MSSFLADENVPFQLVEELRALGHDVETAYEAGLANQGLADSQVLAHAVGTARAVLTNNRRHFHGLHKSSPAHAGIVTFTRDPDTAALAQRIHAEVVGNQPLGGKLIRVTRPP